jgi:hypothetical protein
MPWRKVKIGEQLLLEKGHEMQQIVGVGRQRVGRTPPSTQVTQEASDNGNGLAVIIKQFKGFVMDMVAADMVDSHGSLAPSVASKHLFLSRTNALQSYKCPHNIETPFEKRFQAMLRSAWNRWSWHVIVADPGSGKTMGIRELVQTTGSPVILAVTAPKNDDDEQALGDQLFAALGLKLTGHWRTRKPKLMGHLHQFGTKLLGSLSFGPALEWSFEASETNVRAETLEKAAELLVLRRIIDGAGPVQDATRSDSTGQDQASETEEEGVSESANPPENTAQVHTSPTDNEDQTSSTRSKLAASHDAVMDQKQPVKPPKCTFSGVVPIELKCFLDSGLGLVECPDCACTRTLKPQSGVLRFKSHDKRKTRTPNTGQRWAMCETVWEVVGGESK